MELQNGALSSLVFIFPDAPNAGRSLWFAMLVKASIRRVILMDHPMCYSKLHHAHMA